MVTASEENRAVCRARQSSASLQQWKPISWRKPKSAGSSSIENVFRLTASQHKVKWVRDNGETGVARIGS